MSVFAPPAHSGRIETVAALVAVALATAATLAACQDAVQEDPPATDGGSQDAGADGPRVPRPVNRGNGNDDDGGDLCIPRQPGADLDAQVPAPFAGRTNPLGEDAGAAGQVLYTSMCQRCHGITYRGGGDLNAADLTAHVHTEDYLFWRISKGGLGDPVCSQMPAFEGTLTEEARWQLVAFVRSIEPDAGGVGDAASSDGSPE